MAIHYPNRISLAQTPTPLQPLKRLSATMGGPTIWVKRDDMTGAAVSGNKIRKLEFVLAKAIAQGCDTIITAGGVQSNHCRTTAIVCAQLGLRCHLILRGENGPADGNLLLDQIAGAQLSFYSNAEYTQSEQTIFQHWVDHYHSQGRNAYCIPVGASDGTGLWGYVKACEELRSDFARVQIAPEHIICATGSGGTQAGLIAGCHLHAIGSKVWGVNVCDDKAYFQQKVRADLREWATLYPQNIDVEALAINIIEGYVGPGYAQASDEIFDAIKLAGQVEGLVLDPVYTGKAFYAMLDQIKQGYFSACNNIVFIHTGGIFGLFAQREKLVF